MAALHNLRKSHVKLFRHLQGFRLLQVMFSLQCLVWEHGLGARLHVFAPYSAHGCGDPPAVHACSFLGLLHMEVFLQRLEQEHGASVITTAPTVPYALDLFGGQRLDIQNPSQVRLF